jgi:hypothetical protein
MAATARNYQREYETFHSKPEQIKRRAQRNAARAKMKAAGRDVAGKDVHHKDHSSLSNALERLMVRSKSANRADHK